MISLIRLIILLACEVLSFAIFADVILSWTDVYRRQPSLLFLRKLAETINAPIRRVVPPVNGMDFSPMIAIILLMIIRRII